MPLVAVTRIFQSGFAGNQDFGLKHHKSQTLIRMVVLTLDEGPARRYTL